MIASAIGCGSPSRAPSDASEQPTPDSTVEKGQFADACSKHTDCALGFCVDPVGDTGGVCSRVCNDDCPTGWECRTVDLPQAELRLCVPAAPQLCLACANDDECGGGACLDLDGGGRCAIPCTDECPMGYTCAPDASGTHTGSFCQPVTGSCSCSAELAGATRSCSEMNAVGTCFGTQMCEATGWSACTATTPADETCDGADNNCNFVIDEGVGGGESCAITNAAGSCPGVRQCDGNAGFECIGQTPTMEACNFADDDCDSKTDEGFAGLGDTCSAGIGACTRYGIQTCNGAGTGLTCSAMQGPTATETCNQIDDNCDTQIDEPFKTGGMALGMQCAAGLGVCTQYGSYVCRADGTGTQCSATPGTNATTETCNYLDDNCDGAVDNGFKNAGTGFYDTDQHCGSCGNDCTALYTAQNSFGACAVSGTPQCVMRCDAGTGNLNGSTLDGCEFTVDATAIYVSTTDPAAVDDATCGVGPTGTGTGNHPCKTITFGLTRAVMMSRSNVLVADGTYSEGVTLLNGKNVLGGHRADTWERHLSTTSTVIAGATASGVHDRTVTASAITGATIFEGFVVRGSFNTKPSGNSYAIYIANSNGNLVVRDNQIIAGRGGAGAAGTPGMNGTQGANGGGANGPNDSAYNARSVSGCTASTTSLSVVRQHLNGGVQSCGGDVVSGGNGGGNRCPPSYGDNLTPPQATEKSALDGLTGQPGAGGGGSAGPGGDAGDDGLIHTDEARCIIPDDPTFGVDGAPGTPGTSAQAVSGCSAANGSVAGGDWFSNGGSSGGAGDHGGGGGGGGAGGGAYCYDCVRNPPNTIGGDHRIGGHGGGGGAGGCGGNGGGGGGGGGGVFGIFITGGSAPTITNNAITRGVAGDGGQGGIGGAGGLGGQGGAGGGGELFCTDKAGRGGGGGNAGHGAGGGGGCGGSSFGIFTSGIGSPAYCGSNTVTGGAAGGGGTGGFSGGNSGGAGAAGLLQTCTSL